MPESKASRDYHVGLDITSGPDLTAYQCPRCFRLLHIEESGTVRDVPLLVRCPDHPECCAVLPSTRKGK